jgi:hypothetical protein
MLWESYHQVVVANVWITDATSVSGYASKFSVASVRNNSQHSRHLETLARSDLGTIGICCPSAGFSKRMYPVQ